MGVDGASGTQGPVIERVGCAGEFIGLALVTKVCSWVLKLSAGTQVGGTGYHRGVTQFTENLQRVEERIDAACRRAGRERAGVRLMAVSKVHPAEALAEAVAAGVTLFGENRVQEFEAKRVRLGELGVVDAAVHLIGHLQSNKSAKAAEILTGSTASIRCGWRIG